MNQPLVSVYGENKTAKVLLKYNYKIKIGDILAGPVLGIEKTQMTINLGLRKIAFLPNSEFSISQQDKQNQYLQPNEIGEFIILSHNLNTDKTIISLRRLHYIKLWERIRQINFKNMILTTSIAATTRAGKFTDFDGLNVFVPNSHLTKYYRRKNVTSKFLPLKILEVKDKNRYILGSAKLAFLKKQGPSLQKGLIHTGCVLMIKPFGIFLNVHGLKCLLHISEISSKKIIDITKTFKKGDLIKVKVIYVDSSEGKITVSAKQV